MRHCQQTRGRPPHHWQREQNLTRKRSMATSLLNDIKTPVTPDMVQHLSSLLGESPANTQKAVDQVLPTLLASVMHLSASEDGPTRLVNLINHRNYERLLN